MTEAETVMPTTEMNGNHNHDTTIDPARISFRAPLPDLHSPKLPIHSLGNTMQNSGPHQDFYDQDQLYGQPQEISSGSESDIMESSRSATVVVQVRVPPPPRFPPLPYSSSKTGLVYDSRMRFHAEPTESMLNPDDIHPEDPRRIHQIFDELRQAGLVLGPEDEEDEEADHCWRIETREASKGEITLIHTLEHYRFIESLEGLSPTIYFRYSLTSEQSKRRKS